MCFENDTYWDSFDCEIQCDEDPALAAYEAMLDAGLIDLSIPADGGPSPYQPDPDDDVPM